MSTGRLPNFLIIGVAKSGTSSLYAYLGQHPQIYTCPVRAPNFFGLGEQPDPQYGGPVKFRSPRTPTLLQYSELFAAAGDAPAVGEGSSFYNFTPRAAQRIHQYIPAARLVAILRQPAERAYSQYLYARRLGWEPETSFAAALNDEPRRSAEAWFPFLRYRESSLYAARLRAFYERFPREQLLVQRFDDFCRSTEKVVGEIYAFLGVDPAFKPDVSFNRNPARVGLFPWLRSPYNPKAAQAWRRAPGPLRRRLFAWLNKLAPAPPPLDPALRAQLTQDFQADILATQELTGRDLSAWMASKA